MPVRSESGLSPVRIRLESGQYGIKKKQMVGSADPTDPTDPVFQRSDIMIIVGYDPGFGNSKAALISDGVKTAYLPSVVGVGNTEIGLLDTSMGNSGRRHLPDETSFDGVTYLVGENVANYAEPVERMDFQRLSDGHELRALFYTTMHHLLDNATNKDVRVMVGLPVEIMQDRKLAKATRRSLRKWMVGTHQYQVNGQENNLTITRVEVMPQPAGSYFCWGMNEQGRWSKGADTLRDMIAVCDIGFNTSDLFVLKSGQIVARYTAGQKAGIRRAAEQIIRIIKKNSGVILSLHEADAFLHQSNPTLSTADGVMDLGPIVDQARESVAASVLQFTERQWGDAKRFHHVLFTGGGSQVLSNFLGRAYPHGYVLNDAVVANATGLAKYGLRPLSK